MPARTSFHCPPSQSPLPLWLLASLVALSAPPALPGQLVALHISNGAQMGQELPKRLKLLNWGENKIVKKDPKNPDAAPTEDVVRVGKTTLAALSANQARLGYDRIALDFDHNSLPGHKNFQTNPRRVAAYGVPEVIDGDGLYLKDLEYTPSGHAFAREYCDLSPAPLLNEDREVTFLHSTALTGQGAVVGLSFFSADFLAQPEALAATTTVTTQHGDTGGMSPDLRKLLIALFGAPEAATDEQILAAGKAFVEKFASDSASDDTEAMSVEQTLTQRLDRIERDQIISAAVSSGKIVPASVRTLPLTDLRRIIADLPADQVPLDQRGVALSVTVQTSGAPALGSQADQIRQNCGVSAEAWQRHNPTT